jgi:chloramphenicol O-acetyltransferase type A
MLDSFNPIDVRNWDRKALYEFFKDFDEPFFGVTVQVDVTLALSFCKEARRPFFLHYLHKALSAANQVEAFRRRIVANQPRQYDVTHVSATIGRVNGTFGFSHIDFDQDFSIFERRANAEISRIETSTDLLPKVHKENVIHCSALPWLEFTGLSHARHFSRKDSCPKISFGKVVERGGQKMMPVSINVHHALADGLHVGQFVEAFQRQLNDAT